MVDGEVVLVPIGMLWSSVVIYVLGTVAAVLVVVIILLHTATSSTVLLHACAGTYDAGVVSSVVSPSSWDIGSYYVVLCLLLHELLVVCIGTAH